MKKVSLVALALLAPLLLAGCGSSDKGGRHTGADGSATPRPAAPAAAAPSGDGTSATPSSGAPSPGRTAPGGAAQGPRNTVPDAELTPATGSFTKKEKKYLSGRVPKGMDPAAILQAGQDVCDRLAYTAKVDRDAAVGAVIAGDIKGADAAVNGLCPDQKPLIEAAKGGYADGTHAAPAPGTYRALTKSKDCSWSLDGASGRQHTITVRKGTKTFTSTGCYAWART
ncbi:hypothetical protein [Streptomyces sp. NRRL S-813]|uniref:hypothetical protein n=1 Tax=Streptomyces sp. NRRL S-813 TaxID=1463919 RepID=UPI0004C0A734|nr:hypothetical protein [Streptomyces sp. NRRL S-813]